MKLFNHIYNYLDRHASLLKWIYTADNILKKILYHIYTVLLFLLGILIIYATLTYMSNNNEINPNDIDMNSIANSNDTTSYIIKLKHISKLLHVSYIDLYTLIDIESKHKSTAINKTTKAIGLIQFKPSTLHEMGYNEDEVVHMTRLEQLDIVYMYLSQFELIFEQSNPDLLELYLCIFYPSAVGKPDNFIIGKNIRDANLIASRNKGFDLNSDKIIYKYEIRKYLKNYRVKLSSGSP